MKKIVFLILFSASCLLFTTSNIETSNAQQDIGYNERCYKKCFWCLRSARYFFSCTQTGQPCVQKYGSAKKLWVFCKR